MRAIAYHAVVVSLLYLSLPYSSWACSGPQRERGAHRTPRVIARYVGQPVRLRRRLSRPMGAILEGERDSSTTTTDRTAQVGARPDSIRLIVIVTSIYDPICVYIDRRRSTATGPFGALLGAKRNPCYCMYHRCVRSSRRGDSLFFNISGSGFGLQGKARRPRGTQGGTTEGLRGDPGDQHRSGGEDPAGLRFVSSACTRPRFGPAHPACCERQVFV